MVKKRSFVKDFLVGAVFIAFGVWLFADPSIQPVANTPSAQQTSD